MGADDRSWSLGNGFIHGSRRRRSPEVCMTLGDFFLIKALAITSFSGCILCGKWLSKKGLLPEINMQED